MTSRAVVVTAHGGREVLQVLERPVPEPGPGQVVVEVAAAGVNFIDVYKRQGIYPTAPPYVPGEECAGRVVAVGAGVAGLQVGDRVATASGGHGTMATHALLEVAAVVPVPDEVELDLAAAAMLQGMTAHFLTHSAFPLEPGHVALVHAAAGGVGQLLVQFAKSRGATVIATVGSEAKLAVARAAGADHVLRSDGDVVAEVRKLVPDGVHVAYDGVGRATFDSSLASLRRRGMLVLFGGASGQVPPFDLQRLNAGGSLYITRPTLGHYVADREELLWRAHDVLRAVGSGALRIEIGGRYGLDQVADAYRDLEERRTTGKLLIVP